MFNDPYSNELKRREFQSKTNFINNINSFKKANFSIEQSKEMSPDDAVRIKEMAKDEGVSSDVIEDAYRGEKLPKKSNDKFTLSMAEQDPVLSSYLSDPINASVLSGNIKNTFELGRKYRDKGKDKGFIRSYLNRFIYGAIGIQTNNIQSALRRGAYLSGDDLDSELEKELPLWKLEQLVFQKKMGHTKEKMTDRVIDLKQKQRDLDIRLSNRTRLKYQRGSSVLSKQINDNMNLLLSAYDKDESLLNNMKEIMDAGWDVGSDILSFGALYAKNPRNASLDAFSSLVTASPSLLLSRLGGTRLQGNLLSAQQLATLDKQTFIDTRLQEEGYDLTNRDDYIRALNNPELMSQLNKEGNWKVVGTTGLGLGFNYFSAGRVLGAGALGIVREIMKQAGQESLEEFLGQALARKSLTEVDYGDVAVEGFLSFNTSMVESYIGYYHDLNNPNVDGKDTKNTDETVDTTETKSNKWTYVGDITGFEDTSGLLSKAKNIGKKLIGSTEASSDFVKTVSFEDMNNSLKNRINVSDIYADSSNSVYFQSDDFDNAVDDSDLTMDEFLNQFPPEVRQAYLDAKESGSTFSVNEALLDSKVTDSDLRIKLGLIQRERADSFNAVEGVDIAKEYTDVSNKIADKLKNPDVTEEQTVNKEVVDQLVNSGISKELSDQYATAVTGFYNQLSKMTKDVSTIREALDRFPLQVRKGSISDFKGVRKAKLTKKEHVQRRNEIITDIEAGSLVASVKKYLGKSKIYIPSNIWNDTESLREKVGKSSVTKKSTKNSIHIDKVMQEFGNESIGREYDLNEFVEEFSKAKPYSKKLAKDEAESLIKDEIDRYKDEKPPIFLQKKMGALNSLINRMSKEPKGAYDVDTGIIYLTEIADETTFIHEFSHSMFNIVKELYINNELNEEWTDIFEDTIKTFNIKDINKVSEDQQERIARGFEAFLMEGKAPSKKQRKFFEMMKDFMVYIYKSIRNLGVNLTPAMRRFYSRLIASEEEINESIADYEEYNEFVSADDLGMSESDFELHKENINNAKEESKSKHRAKYLSEYKKQESKSWKKNFKEVRKNLLKGLVQDRDMNSVAILKTGKNIDGSETMLSNLKINRKSLKENNLTGVPKSMVSKDGYPIEEVASILKYNSAEELVSVINDLKDLDSVINSMVQLEMAEKYGDSLIDGSGHEEADVLTVMELDSVIDDVVKAVRKKQREVKPFVDKIKKEHKQGVRKTIDRVPTTKQAKKIADRLLGRRKIYNISPREHFSIFNRLEKKSLIQLRNKEYNGFLTSKRFQKIQIQMMDKSKKIKDQVKKDIKYLKKLRDNKDLRKNIGLAGHDYIDIIDTLLSTINLSKTTKKKLKNRQQLIDWMQSKYDKDEAVDIPQNILDSLDENRNISSLTVNEFEDFVKSIRQVSSRALWKRRLDIKYKDAAIDQIGKEVSEAAEKTGKWRSGPIGLPERSRTKEVGLFFQKLRQVIEGIDGSRNGLLKKYLLDDLVEGSDRATDLNNEWGDELDSALKDNYSAAEIENFGRRYYFDSFGEGGYITKGIALSYMLNSRNEDNHNAVMKSHKFTEDQISDIESLITDNDRDFANRVGKLLDKMSPIVLEFGKKINGVAPPKVENYYPLKYREKEVLSDKELEERDKAFGVGYIFGGMNPNTSFVKERSSFVDYEKHVVDLDLGVLYNHIRSVAHSVSLYEAVQNARRIMNNKDIINSISRYHGPEVLKYINNAIDDIAYGTKGSNTEFQTLLSFLRNNITYRNLAFKPSIALLQTTAMPMITDEFGLKLTLDTLFYDIGVDNFESAVEVAVNESVLLKNRQRGTQDIFLREAKERRTGKSILDRDEFWGVKIPDELRNFLRSPKMSKFKQGIQNNGFNMIIKTQFYMDLLAYLTAKKGYYKRNPNGTEEEAIRLAEQFVRDIMGDSETVNLTPSQKNDVSKTLMIHSTFPMTMLNELWSQYRYTYKNPNFKNVKRSFAKTANYTVNMAAFTTILYMLIGKINISDDDILEEFFKEFSGLALAPIPFLGKVMRDSVTGYRTGNQGALQFLDDVGRAATQTTQFDIDRPLTKSYINLTGVVTKGVPSGAVNGFIDNIIEFSEGDNPNPLGIILF